MLKIRLKRCGRKKQTSFKIVVMNNLDKRDGQAVEELGFINPRTKEKYLNINKINYYLNFGAKPTKTVFNILNKAKIL
ncbi:ribosomal protein S16 (chloroplast) [Galdieria partita]|uniref:Small ribosomal subunit protein bS16c n=1 Tax=Galdieria partita TaxID=83374 RepID=A0A9C7EW19_9RHOD|nr:ribosomal protein S16 [Galdieria partita]